MRTSTDGVPRHLSPRRLRPTFPCREERHRLESCRGAAMNASDVLVERLLAWGVDTIFGLPGDGINGVMEALRKAQDKIRFIHVRHEESAAFMALAFAKFTGGFGVFISTFGPGGI